jgi:uncharacterized caspase-like protein
MSQKFVRIFFLYGICVSGFCLLWVHPASAGTRWAILIGVNSYPKNVGSTGDQQALSWPDLKFAVDDVRALRDALLKVGYAEENIISLDSNASDPNFLPSHRNIVDHLGQLPNHSKYREDDSVMIVFTGHGFTENGESLLCPSDIEINKLQKKGIPVSWISDQLARANVAQRYLVIDACRNEVSNIGLTQFNLLTGLQKLALQKRNSQASTEKAAAPQGIFYFASCLAGQRSVEDDTLGHGVFLHFFTKGLMGLADVQPGGDRDRQVSPYEAFKYAADETRRWTRRVYSWEQQPWVEGRSTAGLHLAEIEQDEHQKLLAGAATIESQAPSAFSLQAQYDLELAIVALHAGDFEESKARVDEAIKFDPANSLARQTRAMLYLLNTVQQNQEDEDGEVFTNAVQAPDYVQALNQMRAVNRPLLLRVSADVTLLNRNNTVATAHQGDVLLGDSINDFQSRQWLTIRGIQRKGKKNTEIEKVSGVVSLDVLSQSISSYDQLQEFDSRNQQPGYLVGGGGGRGQGGGGGVERAETALRWVNFGMGIGGRGGVSMPYGGGGGAWRGYVPGIGSY